MTSTSPLPRPHHVNPPPQRRAGVLFPDLYTWFVLLASVDIIFTWFILHIGGQELNLVADWIIEKFDLLGVVAYKFCLVVLVVTICEITGRKNVSIGQTLARWAVVLTAFPVVVGAIHILTAVLDHVGSNG